MHPVAETLQIRALKAITVALTAAALVIAGYVILQGQLGGLAGAEAAEPIDPSTTLAPVPTTTTPPPATTTTTPVATTTTTPPTTPVDWQPYPARYMVPSTESAHEAKQVAVDFATWLTTYEEHTDHEARPHVYASGPGVDLLAAASEPLTYAGSWSRGEVIYPQLGGLKNGRVSVMVVTRQTVGIGAEAEFSVVRTLDIRLALGEFGWEFASLDSAGGTFDRLEDLTLAHAVARDERIEMPDSARLDILSGRVSPLLLEVMAEMADRTPYGVVTITTGHPHHVFETDRLSHHTMGRAVDIYRVGDRLVIDDHERDSATWALVVWLYDHPDVHQVGSPWDLDGEGDRRSFTDAVHQDHIHIAVEEVGHDDE